MKQFGLIGKTLKHSFSKKYFSQKFENEKIEGCHYDLYELPQIEGFLNLIKQTKNLKGLNVTIPYKQSIIPFLDVLSEEAKQIGAVNTIAFTKNGLVGYNTDIYGFENSLLPLLKPRHKNALILGTGGASKAIAFVLQKLNVSFQFVSRNKKRDCITYDDLSQEIISESLLIINTTPLGTSPNIDQCLNIPYKFLNKQHLLYDLVYNPSTTLFMEKGFNKGATVKNGYEMLVLQAEKAWQIWNQDIGLPLQQG